MSSFTGQTNASDNPSLIKLSLPDRASLSAAYMGVFRDGCVFVPTTQPHRLGDPMVLELNLPDAPTSTQLSVQVAWITPPLAQGGRLQGIGLQLGPDEASRRVHRRIEDILGSSLGTEPGHAL